MTIRTIVPSVPVRPEPKPTSSGRVVIAILLGVLAALAGGTAGACAGASLAWRAATGLPADPAAEAIAGPGSTVTTRVNALFAYDPPITTAADRLLVPLLGGDGYLPGRVELSVPGSDGAPGLIAERARLAADGWDVRQITQDFASLTFWGTKGGLTVEAAVQHQDGGAWEPGVTVTLRRAEPAGARTAERLGWLAGAVVGLALLFLLIRGRRVTAVYVLTGAGLVIMLPATGAATVLAWLGEAGPAADPPWWVFTEVVLRGPADLGAGLVLAAAAVALAKRQPRTSIS